MNLEKIKCDLQKYLSENKLKLFETKYDKHESTLSIILDETLSIDDIETISNKISNFLDKYDEQFDDNYILDVSTVGAERPIRSETELIEAIGKYIFVSSKDGDYYGFLKEYVNGILQLETKDKTRIKNISIDYKKVNNVRYAVKF